MGADWSERKSTTVTRECINAPKVGQCSCGRGSDGKSANRWANDATDEWLPIRKAHMRERVPAWKKAACKSKRL
jgi:hypothetical protein